MNINNLNELPDWDDEDFNDDEREGEDWKTSVTNELGKALYERWDAVMMILIAAFESMKEPAEDIFFNKDYFERQKEIMLGDAYEVAAKLRSSEVGNYVIRMENAAVIRKHAQFVNIGISSFVDGNLMEEEHGVFIKEEIVAFRMLFRQWVASFEKDEYEDEWGLFN